MSFFQLVLKQMRQRALSTWLTMLSVVLGVALGSGIMVVQRGAGVLFGQTDYGYDVIVGPKGSALQLTLNTVYQLDKSPGNVPYSLYEQLMTERKYRANVRVAVPMAVGDSYKGQRIVASNSTFVETPLTLAVDAEYGQSTALDQVKEKLQLNRAAQAQQPPRKLENIAQDDLDMSDRALASLGRMQNRVDGPDVYEPGTVAALGDALQEVKAGRDAVKGLLGHPPDEALAKTLEAPMGKLSAAVKSLSAASGLDRVVLADGPIEYRPDQPYQIGQGRMYHPRKFEAIIGSDIPELTGLKLGDKFRATHGLPDPNITPDIHPEEWTIVGVLKPTHTAADRVLYIPLTTFYCIFEHEAGLQAISQLQQGTRPAPPPATKPAEEEAKHYAVNPDGTIDLKLPKDEWLVSAILVRSRGGYNAQSLMWDINNQNVAAAVNPASEMRKFFDFFLAPSAKLLAAVSYLVTIVAGVGILVSIYNSVSARTREIAILRALGATRTKVLGLICCEAGLIGLIGGVVGLLVGHLVGGLGSIFVQKLVGEGFDWINMAREEWIYLMAVVALSVLAGLVPALKAYRTPVADNLVAG